jgi:hypothetical protein
MRKNEVPGWILCDGALVRLKGCPGVGFPVSTSECCDGSQVSKLLLHASHVALPT